MEYFLVITAVAVYITILVTLARAKNRRVWVWLLFGLIFPIVALVVLIFAYPLANDGEHESGLS